MTDGCALANCSNSASVRSMLTVIGMRCGCTKRLRQVWFVLRNIMSLMKFLLPQRVLCMLLLTAGPWPGVSFGQTSSPYLNVKVVAETESGGRISSAARVASGDYLLYTLEVRNDGPVTLHSPVVVHPIPEHMVYLAESAVGPGVAVTYSVDGGRTFLRPQLLKMRSPGGGLRPAKAADYTDIRWQLRINLKPGATAFVRYRAMVK